MNCLIKFNHMNFCPRLSYASWCVCVVAMEGIFFIPTFLCSDNLPVKLIEETFHCCCDISQIFYTRGYGKSLGIGVLFSEHIA